MKFKVSLSVVSFLSFLFVFSASCSGSDGEITNEGGDVTGNQEVIIKPEREKLIRNPMMGWVLYAGIGDGLLNTFWDDYDKMPVSYGSTKVKVSDYATTLYIRGAWSDFNPQKNVFIWDETTNTEPAKRFRLLVNEALKRNMKLAFTFVVDSRDKRYDFTPAYVKNAMGEANGYVTTTGSVQVWSPYPDNPVFQQYYEQFIEDFARKYDDPDIVQFISGQGLGKWGEYHTCKYSTGNDNPREAVFNFVTDLYANSFKKVPVIINYHRWIGSGKEWDGTNVDPNSERLINSAVAKGFSLRHDAFGMKTYYTTWERNYAASKKYQRPIIMEGGWVKTSHGNSIKGDGYSDYSDVRKGEFDEGKGAFVNMMDLRYNSDMLNSETFSWFNDAFDLVNQFITDGGYRLYPDRVTLPPSIKNGSSIKITHRWINLGWGYCPTNIPQWKDRFKIAFALLDKQTLSPKHIFVDQAPELSECVKGSPRSYTSTPTITGVAAGNYTWAIGIVDTRKDNAIGIQIAAKENITSEGWVKLLDVEVK